MGRTVAVIGSFKQHNDSVQRTCQLLRSAGFTVTSPRGSEILNPGIDFVRFQDDPPDWLDPDVQSLALHRIFQADAVLVAAPGGYVGKTTCYEIGRIIQRKQPIYFSEHPKDLPIAIPARFVLDTQSFIKELSSAKWKADWLFIDDDLHSSSLERELASGAFRSE